MDYYLQVPGELNDDSIELESVSISGDGKELTVYAKDSPHLSALMQWAAQGKLIEDAIVMASLYLHLKNTLITSFQTAASADPSAPVYSMTLTAESVSSG